VQSWLEIGLGVAVAAVFAALPACNGDGGGSCQLDGPLAPVDGDVAGCWLATDTVVTGDCAGQARQCLVSVSVSGNGVSAQVVTCSGGPFTGTASGSQIRWSGSYDDGAGTTTISCGDVTVTGDTFSGSNAFSWSNGVDSCTGRTRLEGVRQTGSCP
jgi:hypothetical protein